MSSCPIGSGNPGGKGNGTINPALAPAGTSSPKSKQSPANSAAPSSASPHPPSDGSHQSWGDSSPISANSGTSFLSEASLSTFNESIRQRNAAFSLSPRTESESDFASDEVRTPHQSFSFELDKCSPPEVKTVSLGSTESRRHFICEQCATLAANMSSKRIVEDLLPALIRIFDTDESCALLVVKILPEVVSAMDVRTTNFMVCFLGLLMQLCCSAEAASAIDEVTRSIRKIITQLDDEVILETILPFIVAMRVSFWSTPRAIATGVLGVLAVRPAVVRGSGVPVMEWFNWFIDSSGSSSVPVRLAAVASLHQWIAVAKVHQLRTAEMPLPLVHQFLTDDLSDMVRYHLVRETLSMAKLLGRTATSKYLQSTYLSACKDASWRVRYFAAANLGEMCKLVLYADDLSKVVTALSEDEEPEIRAAVAGQLDRLEHYVSAATIEKICAPVALRLAADPIVVVRSSAVQHLHPLVQLTKEETASTVCKVVVQLMQDASLRVQLSAIRSLESIITALVTPPASSPPDSRRTSDGGRDVKGHDQSSGSRSTPSDDQRRRVDLLSSMFVRHLQNISNSGNWRLRDAVARVVPIFAAAMNLNQFTPLAELLRTLLQDPVCHVRVQAVAALGAVGTFYGCEWAANMATQLLMKDFCAKSKASYTSRVVAVRCMDRLLPIVSHMGKQDMRRQHVVHLTSEFLRSHTSDPVSNVRLALAQSLPSWKDWCSATHDEQVQYNNSVRTLQGDSVTDVRDAAFAATTFHLSGSH